MQIQCRCGHLADFDEFTRTPIRGELPKGHYQCPECGRAWHRKETTPGQMIHTEVGSFYKPGRIECVADQSSM